MKELQRTPEIEWILVPGRLVPDFVRFRVQILNADYKSQAYWAKNEEDPKNIPFDGRLSLRTKWSID
jgi:hypothetical protein